MCASNTDCVLVSFQSETCKLYKILQTQYFIDSSENILFKKKDNKYIYLKLSNFSFIVILSKNLFVKIR